VVGATETDIVSMLVIDFAKAIVIANIIAWPLAYYFINNWLENYAYRIQLSWWIFVLAGLFTLIIALMTVGWLAIRAATSNPAKALRYE
jgi:putative ABC transport system permease protein